MLVLIIRFLYNNEKLRDEFLNYKVSYSENYKNVDVVDYSVSVELVDKCIKNIYLFILRHCIKIHNNNNNYHRKAGRRKQKDYQGH